jgi:hypothetical protein
MRDRLPRTDGENPPPVRERGTVARRIVARVRALSKRIGMAEARLIISAFYWIGLGPAALASRRSAYVREFFGGEARWRPMPPRDPRESARVQH